MTKKRYIYSLTDPRTKKVFYIGQSKNPDVRLLNHIHKSHLLKTPKDYVLTELIKIGQVPRVKVLEEIEVDPANKQSIFSVSKREKYWINEIFGDGILNIQKNNIGELNETCLYCENKFHKKHKRGKFCSSKCKVYWHRENPKVTLKNFNKQSIGNNQKIELKAVENESIDTTKKEDWTKLSRTEQMKRLRG